MWTHWSVWVTWFQEDGYLKIRLFIRVEYFARIFYEWQKKWCKSSKTVYPLIWWLLTFMYIIFLSHRIFSAMKAKLHVSKLALTQNVVSQYSCNWLVNWLRMWLSSQSSAFLWVHTIWRKNVRCILCCSQVIIAQ